MLTVRSSISTVSIHHDHDSAEADAADDHRQGCQARRGDRETAAAREHAQRRHHLGDGPGGPGDPFHPAAFGNSEPPC
jgi:hypothetical protein